MKQQTDTQLITKQKPLTFIASDPIEVVPVIPPNPQAAGQIRRVILQFFAAKIAQKLIEQSQQKVI